MPLSAQHAILRRVPREVAYAPTLLPRGWRYRAWDAGQETPGLFPRGHGLNIWFTTHHPSGAGLHVFADSRCRRQGSMKRFRVAGVTVSWVSNFGDDRVWRCIRAPSATIEASVSYIGSPASIARGAALALPVARMLATIRRLPRRG